LLGWWSVLAVPAVPFLGDLFHCKDAVRSVLSLEPQEEERFRVKDTDTQIQNGDRDAKLYPAFSYCVAPSEESVLFFCLFLVFAKAVLKYLLHPVVSSQYITFYSLLTSLTCAGISFKRREAMLTAGSVSY
jgi:hypothetical protein